MKKKIIAVLMSFFLAASFTTSSYANSKTKPEKTNIGDLVVFYDAYEDIGSVHFPKGPEEIIDRNYRLLFVNGYAIDSVEVITRDNRTLVPIRIVSEILGGTVGWDDKSRKVTINKTNTKIEMTIGSKNVKVNNSSKIIDVEPIIYHERTYLPLRFVSENLGAEVGYYDNKNENSLGIVNRIPQVTIDEKYDSSVKVISKQDAATQIKKALQDSFNLQKRNINSSTIPHIEKSISAVSHTYDVSRYYIFTGIEGIYDIIFDKYTSDIYKRSFTQIQTIREFKIDDAMNFVLAG